MRTRTLGRSGLEVSEIGFGCGPGARLMVGDDEVLQLQTVETAFEVGISYFDTAAGYGDGRSESNLGRVLNALMRPSVVSTKVVLESTDLGDVAGTVMRSAEASLDRLGVETVDALILHNRVAERSDFPKPPGSGVLLHLPEVFGAGGVAEAFRALLDQGLVGSVGFTAFGGERSAIDEMIGCGLFTSMNAAYSVLNPSANFEVASGFSEPDYDCVIRRAETAGLGVMAIRVLGGGVLATLGASDPRLSRLSALAGDLECSVEDLAVRFVLSTPGVQTAVLGLSEVEHVRAAAAATAEGPLDPEVFSELARISLLSATP